MPLIPTPQVQQITPGVAPIDLFQSMIVDLGNGTAQGGTIIAALRTATSGASGYSEGTTAGTASGQAIVVRDTGGTFRIVGTAYPLPVQEQYAPTYEDNTAGVAKFEIRNSSAHITAIGTTVIKGTATGVVHSLAINTRGQGANVATLYDSPAGTSGTVLAVIDTTSGDGKLYDVSFTNGLVIGVAGGTAGDLTVSYR